MDLWSEYRRVNELTFQRIQTRIVSLKYILLSNIILYNIFKHLSIYIWRFLQIFMQKIKTTRETGGMD
jgi:hypothetical protein